MYIDDLSEAEAISLKRQVISDTVIRQYPLNYHERTGHIFPTQDSLLQRNLLRIEDFTIKNKMVINENKSNLMLFNKSRKIDFQPEISFRNGQNLEIEEETRLLGVIISSDLRWEANTLAICSKAMTKMWLLRRMKLLKLEKEIILEYYLKEVRPLTEQGVPIWNSSLTKSQVRNIEKIQKVALKIILGHQYKTYESACEIFGLQKLSTRRLDLSTNLQLSCIKAVEVKNFLHLSLKM